jgi:hypothetical protein
VSPPFLKEARISRAAMVHGVGKVADLYRRLLFPPRKSKTPRRMACRDVSDPRSEAAVRSADQTLNHRQFGDLSNEDLQKSLPDVYC